MAEPLRQVRDLPTISLMPVHLCPHCGCALEGDQFELPIDEWYAKYHPKLKVGSPIPHVCEDCRAAVAIGDSVWIGYPTSPSAYRARIVEIIESPDGNLYRVLPPEGLERTVIRSQIKLPAERRTGRLIEPTAHTTGEGYF
jgi:hypothetical protein